MTERLVAVKRQIKEWEKLFQREKGLTPLKRDIVDDPKIHQLYREYKQIRYGKENNNHNHSKSHKRRLNVSKEQVDWSFLMSDDEEDFEGGGGIGYQSPHKLKLSSATTKVEIGPTPQASGRILSIFDFKPTPPESSPLMDDDLIAAATPSKKRKEATGIDDLQYTPSKRLNLVFSASPSKNAIDTPKYLKRSHHVDLSPMKAKVSQSNTISPIRPRAPLVFDVTPTKTTPVIDFSVSPSPFKAHRSLTKKLSDIFNDSKSSVVSELEALEEVQDAPEEEDVEEEAEEDQEGNTPFKIKKHKTQKRSTRRWKIKPITMEEEEDIIGSSNLQQRMQLLEQEEIANIQSGMNIEEEEEMEKEEELDLEKELSINVSSDKKQKYVSQNYKRLKINDPRTRAFKRRMNR